MLLRILLYLVIFIVVAAIVLRLLIPSLSPQPDNLGVTDGKLAPCPNKPNCVSSFATDAGHAIEPIAFAGSAADARSTLLAALNSLPNVSIQAEQAEYIHAATRSRIMGYVDDNEFLIDESASVIHLRAAARLGHSDMGANRARIESIREQFGALSN